MMDIIIIIYERGVIFLQMKKGGAVILVNQILGGGPEIEAR